MTEKQEHLLQLFRELDEICKKNNLRYVMAGGTAIGVVRNEGFIPWDDDVDIYMPRDDWNKLVEISGSVLPEHRALQCVDVDRSYTNTFPRYVATDSCALHKHQIIGRNCKFPNQTTYRSRSQWILLLTDVCFFQKISSPV